MAVYTDVAFDEAAALLQRLNLGELTALRGIQGGIENTNYFVTSQIDGHSVEHVLTVFERLSFEQLPFYLRLMQHLAQRGIPVPAPAADASGALLHTLQGKPAAVVDKLRGRSELSPTARHCAAVGALLARMQQDLCRRYALAWPEHALLMRLQRCARARMALSNLSDVLAKASS